MLYKHVFSVLWNIPTRDKSFSSASLRSYRYMFNGHPVQVVELWSRQKTTTRWPVVIQAATTVFGLLCAVVQITSNILWWKQLSTNNVIHGEITRRATPTTNPKSHSQKRVYFYHPCREIHNTKKKWIFPYETRAVSPTTRTHLFVADARRLKNSSVIVRKPKPIAQRCATHAFFAVL